MSKINNKTILLTGATGFIGSYLLTLLLKQNKSIYILAREKKNVNPEERVHNTIRFWDKSLLKNKSQIKVLHGDISHNQLGLSREQYRVLKNSISDIYHCAAAVQYNQSEKQAFSTNIIGTHNILELGVKTLKNGLFNKTCYLSTAFVCGHHKGIFSEEHLNVAQDFPNPYFLSKYKAEILANEYKQKIPVNIFRPAVVLGEMGTGKILSFNQTLYQIFRIWKTGIFDFFPGKDLRTNAVFVDELCKAIVLLMQKGPVNQTYHSFPEKSIPLSFFLSEYKKFFRLKTPIAINTTEISKHNFTPTQYKFLNYSSSNFNGSVQFTSQKTNAILKKFNFHFSLVNKNNIIGIYDYLKRNNTLPCLD